MESLIILIPLIAILGLILVGLVSVRNQIKRERQNLQKLIVIASRGRRLPIIRKTGK